MVALMLFARINAKFDEVWLISESLAKGCCSRRFCDNEGDEAMKSMQ